MSHHLLTSAVVPTDDTPRPADRLRRLHLARSAFALVWAASFALSASSLGTVSIGLLVVYPVVDAAAALVDRRSSADPGPRGPLALNVALSLAVAVALALAATSGEEAVLAVWGVWAVAAGVLQLVVAAGRRARGGQWALVASGALSTVAGAGFVVASTRPEPSLTGLAGYAALGGLFFLASALRLRRR